MDKEQVLDYVMHTPANTNRAVLEDMIDILLNDFFIEKIRETITKAEASGLQMDKDASMSLVVSLPDGEEKTELEQRLAILQEYINAISAADEAVTLAEAGHPEGEDHPLYDAAELLVDALQDGDLKTELEQRLAILQESINTISATNAVLIAEQEPNMENFELAQMLVSVLMQGEDRSTLESRLAVVEEAIKVIDATEAVELAEVNYPEGGIEDRPLYDEAELLVDALQDGDLKTALMNRLDSLDYGTEE